MKAYVVIDETNGDGGYMSWPDSVWSTRELADTRVAQIGSGPYGCKAHVEEFEMDVIPEGLR